EARERATEARKLLLDGIDPLQAKRARFAALRVADASAVTFRQCAEDFIKANEVKWTAAQHRREWSWSLRKYVYPILGSMPVAAIDTPLVLKVLKPIWEKTPESASRIRGRIENVLGWATVHHYRSGDNPARWNGLLEHALPSVVKGDHHASGARDGQEMRAVVCAGVSGQSAVRKGVSAQGPVRCISVAARQQTLRYCSNWPIYAAF